MSARKSGLGKGLDSLITDKVSQKQVNEGKQGEGKAELYLRISEVEPNRDQPRKIFDEDSLNELAESIRQHGILQPLLVAKRDGYYEIIAGERRWRAAKIAGLREVPVIVKNMTDREILEVSLIENIQREDLNPIEEAKAYEKLMKEFDLKQEELAEKVSKSRAAVANSIRLLKLSSAVQDMIVKGELSAGHARTLIGIDDPKIQEELANEIADQKMSVREAEKFVKKSQNTKKPPNQNPEDKDSSYIYENMQEQMKKVLGTKVTVNRKKNHTGNIEIEYYSEEDLDRILEMILSIR